MSITREEDKQQTKVYLNKDILIFKDLVLWNNPKLIGDYEKTAKKINQEFNTNITGRTLFLLESPTIRLMEEDLKLIYKHNNLD